MAHPPATLYGVTSKRIFRLTSTTRCCKPFTSDVVSYDYSQSPQISVIQNENGSGSITFSLHGMSLYINIVLFTIIATALVDNNSNDKTNPTEFKFANVPNVVETKHIINTYKSAAEQAI